MTLSAGQQAVFYAGQPPTAAGDQVKVSYTVYGVGATLSQSPNVVFLNDKGYTYADTKLNYTILPPEYNASTVDVDLLKNEGWDNTLTGITTQGSDFVTISAGSVLDVNSSYTAQVVLNRGSEAEVRGEEVPVPVKLLRPALIPDCNRDGVIDDTDRTRALAGDTFYFWINDDDDEGDTGGTDIPGTPMKSSGYINADDFYVNGVRDLIDFFPVWLDIKDLLSAYDPGSYTYKLQSADESLNFVLTDLEALHAGYYLRGDDNDLQIPQALGNANTIAVSKGGTVLNAGFLESIKGGTKGVILLEGKKVSSSPLELAVYDSNQARVFSVKLNLSLSGVEQMFRHENLSRVTNKDLVPGPGSTAGELDRLDEPKNCPDVQCTGIDSINGKNFVFLHGYNVNGQEARGWQSAMFKRLFWSGSKARFYGVTWYGWDSQLAGVTPNFHVNVQHAFATAPDLKSFLYNNVFGEVTIAAHSLGNMIVSAMLTDNADGWDNSGKIKNYFMLDAAVASEAYGFADDPEDLPAIELNVVPEMTHPDWNDYDKRLWSSEWHLFFDQADNRRKLTWRNIFLTRPSTVKYYNYFSSGEDVLDKHEGYPEVPDIVTKGIGRYAWALQEKLKGRVPLNDILGSNYGGWGFNLIDYYDKDVYLLTQEYKVIQPTTTYNISDTTLRTKPFFVIGNESDLYKEETGSQYALDNKIRLLADAFPARTLAAGKNEVLGLIESSQNKGENHDMQSECKTSKPARIDYWPDIRTNKFDYEWKHNDIKEIAYPFVFTFFDDIAGKGGLK